MHHLFLLRHGAAETAGLYKEGIVQAQDISTNIVNYLNNRAEELASKSLPFEYLSKTVFLYSKSQRTTETAEIIEEGLLKELVFTPFEFVKWKSDELYSSEDISKSAIGLIDRFEDFGLGILVGHNPDIGVIAETLSTKHGLSYDSGEEFYGVGNCSGYHINFSDGEMKSVKHSDKIVANPKSEDSFEYF